MIIIRISGGIGNQLFQYALGRALSLRNGGPATAAGELKLDTSFYGLGIEPDRSFKLPHFNIPGIAGMIAGPADFKRTAIPDPAKQDLLSKMRRRLYRFLESRKPLAERKVILEPGFGFYPEVAGLTGDHYMSGVWQSEKYFAGYAEQIRKDLASAAPLSAAAEDMARRIEIAGAGSVSVHIRRGDQVHDPRLLKKYGRLCMEYYLPAVEYIAGKIAAPQLFIFSDDIEWCQKNMRFNLPTTYVSTAHIPDYEAIVLMSLCRHNIIAKSSFSWWSAWLNADPGKIVVAPKQRFGTEAQRADDLIPEGWIKI